MCVEAARQPAYTYVANNLCRQHYTKIISRKRKSCNGFYWSILNARAFPVSNFTSHSTHLFHTHTHSPQSQLCFCAQFAVSVRQCEVRAKQQQSHVAFLAGCAVRARVYTFTNVILILVGRSLLRQLYVFFVASCLACSLCGVSLCVLLLCRLCPHVNVLVDGVTLIVLTKTNLTTLLLHVRDDDRRRRRHNDRPPDQTVGAIVACRRQHSAAAAAAAAAEAHNQEAKTDGHRRRRAVPSCRRGRQQDALSQLETGRTDRIGHGVEQQRFIRF